MRGIPAGALLLLALAAGITLRLPQLRNRVMHGDEAIQAVKTWELRETGAYAYDSSLYHGPAMAWASIPLLLLNGHVHFAQTDESDYRLVPAILGILLIALVWLLRDGIGAPAAALAAVFTAVSPSLVYYSRCYIQEVPLVFLTGSTIACGWRYSKDGRRGWLYAACVSAGLMLAAKETAFIALAAMLAAALVSGRRLPGWRDMAGPAASGLGAAALLFSGFLTRPAELVDAFAGPLNYVRLGLDGGVHRHPWHYYLGMLLFSKLEAGSTFSEAAIVLPGAAGIILGWRAGGLPRFLAAYASLMACVYSLIPYKTPWCMLSFLHAFCLLAGFAIVRTFDSLRHLASGIATSAILAATSVILATAFAHLGWQAYRASFTFPSDRRNPYVYAHPVPDVTRLARTIERLAAVHSDGKDMLVRVIGRDCWPLPWYLRSMRRVGYWPEIPANPKAPVIVVPSDLAATLDKLIGPGYTSCFFGLRPDVVLKLYAEAGLWKESLGLPAAGE